MNWKAPVCALRTSRPIRELYSTLSKARIIGRAVKQLVRTILPTKTHIWSRINSGPGKGLRIRLDPRFEMDYVSGVYEEVIERTLP